MRSGLTVAVSSGADPVRVRAFHHLDARLRRDHPAPVALALSGGGDSLALLRLAAEWCAFAGRPLLALTVDHGLHPASPGWTAFAGARARAAGAEWRALPWQGDKPLHGLPAAARAARHALLAEAARAAGARVVLMGHTAADAAEGERMRAADAPTLGRLRVWGPSPVWPEGRGVALLRPLLEVGRAELRDWLRAEGEAEWIDDPANHDLRSPRIRARVAGAAGDTPHGDPPPELADLARSVTAHAEGRLVVPAPRLDAAPAGLRTRVLAAAAVCAGGHARPPGGARAGALAASVGEGDPPRTLRGARIVRDAGAIVFTRAPPRRPLPPLPLAPGEARAWDGRFTLCADAPGWSVAPLAGHAAALPPGDRRRLATVVAAARPMLPVLLGPEGAVALPRPFGEGPAEAVGLVGPRLLLALGALRTEAELAAACADAARSYPPASPPCR